MCNCCRKLDFQWNVRTFEADSVSEPIRELYIWGIGLKCMEFGLKCTEFHTFEADFIYFLMWSDWANHRKSASNVQIGLKCMESAENIWGIGLKCTYIWGRLAKLISDQMCHKSLISCSGQGVCSSYWNWQGRNMKKNICLGRKLNNHRSML